VDPAERHRLRREILEEVGVLLHASLAADEWGRVLVEVVRDAQGEALVAGIDVEEIVGDEARVDAVFASDAARAALPVLAKACEALGALDGVELDDVRGGTFLRLKDGTFAWLPGLVHTPSATLDRAWDDVVAKLDAKNAELERRFGLSKSQRAEVALEAGRITFFSKERAIARANAVLLGTFARATRTWGWGATNPHVPEAARKAAAAVVDAIPERDAWELSTPVFATDEHTAWALAAFVCDRAGGEGVWRAPEAGGVVMLLLRDVTACDDDARSP
jgi:hypothetical protein